MRKNVSLLSALVLLVTLLLSACVTSEDIDAGDITMPNNGDEYNMPSKDFMLIADSYEEYQALILQHQLPEGFDHFNNFAYLGEFKEYRGYVPLVCGYYYYKIVDQAQIELKLYIAKEDQWSKSETLSDTDINPVDMRTLPSKQRGEYEVNGLTYHYAMGELLYISWWRDGKYYELSPEIKGDYPIEASTVFAKLLNIQGEDYPLMCWLLAGNKAS
ncbi:MAG: hypothetical protein J6A88_06265 [Oscillospiraceae bacterium]|nr:hypothetical protein [Oscillospiraceae bacterium]